MLHRFEVRVGAGSPEKPFAPVGVAPSQMITSSIASQSLLGGFWSSAQANSAVLMQDGAVRPLIDSGGRRTVSCAVNFLRLSPDLRRPTYDTDAQNA